MNFKRKDIDNIFLYDTKVENIFINELMINAPGDYVKIYLLGCMYAENNMPVDNQLLARQLNITEGDVQRAWHYWQEQGVISAKGADGQQSEICFLNLKELMFNGGKSKEEKDVGNLIDTAMASVYKSIENLWGLLLNGKELEEIADWPNLYGISPELIEFGVKYCGDKDKCNVRYLERVIQGWAEAGCKRPQEAQNYLNENEQKYYRYKRVFKALGFKRNATENEISLMESWFDQMKCSMDTVLSACEKTSGIGNPNLNYVNKVLQNWNIESKGKDNGTSKKVAVSQTVLKDYYEFLRNNERENADLRRKEVYDALPRIREIDNKISKLSVQMSKSLVLGGKTESRKINKQIDELMADRAITLTENNFEIDYTDIKYSCEKCKDTGTTDDGDRCDCVKQRIKEAEIWQQKRS